MGHDGSAAPAPQGGNQGEAGSGDGSSTTELLKEFRTYRDHMDEQFAKVNGRVSDMGKQMSAISKGREFTPEPPANGETPAPPQVTSDDLDAAIRWGEIRGQLPEKSRERFQAMIDSGRSRQDALMMAEAVIDELGAQAPAAGKPTHPGTPRGAAPTNAGGLPTTYREVRELKRKNPELYQEIVTDPAFDPSALKYD